MTSSYSAEEAAKLNNSIMVTCFNKSIALIYKYDSVEDFHNQLNQSILNFDLTDNDITDMLCEYNSISKTINTWMILNNKPNLFYNITDEDQTTILDEIFPTKKANFIKTLWMQIITNLILYQQISNNGSCYGFEGYRITRESSFTVHHLMERNRNYALCVFSLCKKMIGEETDINEAVNYDHCRQMYCCESHKQNLTP